VIDLNRSIGHPQLFSTATGGRRRRRCARRIVERHYGRIARKSAAREALGFARPPRDPYFVAQLHAFVVRRGAKTQT